MTPAHVKRIAALIEGPFSLLAAQISRRLAEVLHRS
jgi:hypothetical protein